MAAITPTKCGVCGEFNAGKVIETKSGNFHLVSMRTNFRNAFIVKDVETISPHRFSVGAATHLEVVKNKPYCNDCGRQAFLGRTTFQKKPDKDALWEKKAEQTRLEAERQAKIQQERRAALGLGAT